MNDDFILRLRKTFDNASMAVVARRLGIPHATVRNYYQGRIPSPEVLIKIASETGVSLNWLLMGTGEMYAGEIEPIGLGKFLETKIAEIVEHKLAERENRERRGISTSQTGFDIEAAIAKFRDPQEIMSAWFKFDGLDVPDDYGVVFFRGWESFSSSEKEAAIRDARRVLDRSLIA